MTRESIVGPGGETPAPETTARVMKRYATEVADDYADPSS